MFVSAVVDVLPPSRRTLNFLLAEEARIRGDNPFLRVEGHELTVDGLRTLVARRAGALRAAGIAPGDRIVVLANNGLEPVELFLASAWNGSVAVPVNVAARGAQLEHVIDNVAPKAIVVSPELHTLVAERSARGGVEHVWTLPSPLTPSVSSDLPELGEEAEPYDADPGETVAILYTSGTTGPSKGVCCPHAQFYWWGVNTAEALGLSPDDVLHTCLPLFHTNALNTIVQALVRRAQLVITGRFSASRFWDTVAECGATATYLLGAMASISRAGSRQRAIAPTR